MLQAYLAERLPARVFVPIAFALACAAHAATAQGSILAFSLDACVLFVMVAQFRVWDDLVDRPLDAVAHPDRVLVRASSPAPFRLLCAVLAIVSLALLASVYPGRGGVALLAACHVGAAAWYARRRPRSAWRDHVLLAKYPAFVLVIAIARGVDRPAVLACSAGAVYLAACLYEALHDPDSPSSRHTPLVVCEAVLLVVSSTAAAIGALI